jgi:predicted phage terminase large subunit-like protein
VTTVIEQEPAGGKESAERTVRLLAGYDCRIDPARESKESRAEAFSAQAEAGNVRVLNRSWTEAYLDELGAFPDSDYADQVDASAGAFNYLAKTLPVVGDDCPAYAPDGEGILDQLPPDTFA